MFFLDIINKNFNFAKTMASYFVVVYQLEEIKDGINEILENASSFDNSVIVNTKRVDRASDFDNSLCGIEFTKEQAESLKKMVSNKNDVSSLNKTKGKAL